MRKVSSILGMAFLATAAPAAAQSQTPRSQDNDGIVVTGTRAENGKPIPMSDWRVAETQHLLVFSKGDEKRLTRIAHNLEKLHFLLSVLLNRVDEPDDTVKLSVTLIGDYADFDQLNLRNLRWQQGPFPKAFPSERYYDPREDGAVLATTHIDQKVILQQGVVYGGTALVPAEAGVGRNLASDSGYAPATLVNEISFPMTAAGRLYAGFAQHYLMTYFPAAYPRWYLDGFGEIFATISAEEDGVIEYGRRPDGFREVSEWYGRYPLKKVFSGEYLSEKRGRTSWNPYRAWALTHLLFFSDEHKTQLNRYLAATARGAAPDEAAKALDVEKLQRELAGYQGRKVPFERMTYPPERAPAPIVRQLTRSEAGFVRGRLELGARIEIPPPAAPGADPDEAADRAKALARRADWLERVRQNAGRYPKELELQLLLAEAECRSGNGAPCEAAADRALTLAPKSASALAWKGIAQAQEASAAPASERKAKLRAARATIVRANRADPEAVLPLLAYYRSFTEAGETPPLVSVDGVAKAVESVPSAPSSRLDLGQALAGRGQAKPARRILLPVAKGPYESPEKPKARALLEALKAE
jgi:hypothetical protein